MTPQLKSFFTRFMTFNVTLILVIEVHVFFPFLFTILHTPKIMLYHFKEHKVTLVVLKNRKNDCQFVTNILKF